MNTFLQLKVLGFNTAREIVRDRIFYVILGFGLFLILFSLLLGALSFEEQQRILFNLSVSAVHIFSVFLVFFLGAFAIAKEIEKQTFAVILARPVSRSIFLVGKWLGVFIIMAVSVVLIMILVWGLLGFENLGSLLLISLGIILEALVLLSLSFFLSLLFRPYFALFVSFGVYLIGHFLEELRFFAKKSQSEFYKGFSEIVSHVFPNLQMFNFRYMEFFSSGVEMQKLALALAHAALWVFVFLLLGVYVFKRRDFT